MMIFLFFSPTFWKQRHSPVSTEWLFIHTFRLKPSEYSMWGSYWENHVICKLFNFTAPACEGIYYSSTAPFVSSTVFIPAFSYWCGGCALVALSCLKFWSSASSECSASCWMQSKLSGNKNHEAIKHFIWQLVK